MLLASSALALGFLHGLGADHLMAIAALSMVPPAGGGPSGTARTFHVAIRFAFGHAVLLAAGLVLIVFAGWTIPVIFERTGEVAGGCVLIALGAIGLWAAFSRRVYGHSHAHGIPPHAHWHLHLGRRERHPLPTGHSHVPTVVGAVFAVSGLRALTMLAPFGIGRAHPSLSTLLALVAIFAVGILLSMSLFGIVLARTLGTAKIASVAGQASAATALASIAFGLYWVLWRTGSMG